MKTWERVQKAAAFFSEERLGFRGQSGLLELLRSELGSEDILDNPVVVSNGVRMQAFAPRSIYHICAANLDVSAEMSLLLGCLLGSEMTFKIPKTGLPGFEKKVLEAGKNFDVPTTLLREHDPVRMAAAGAVVVFGSDATVERVHSQTKAGQRFLVYGQKFSVGLILPGTAASGLAALAAEEVAAYEQRGCLSPQAYLCPDFVEAERWAGLLSEALEKKELEQPSPSRPFEEEGLVFEARQRALLRGNRLWGAAEHRPWTVVLRQDGFLEPGPGGRFIQVVPGSDWESVLQPWKGRLSSLSLSPCLETEADIIREKAQRLGFSRICPVGSLQNPGLLWRHDGRPRLGDMVTWVTLEEHGPATPP